MPDSVGTMNDMDSDSDSLIVLQYGSVMIANDCLSSVLEQYQENQLIYRMTRIQSTPISTMPKYYTDCGIVVNLPSVSLIEVTSICIPIHVAVVHDDMLVSKVTCGVIEMTPLPGAQVVCICF